MDEEKKEEEEAPRDAENSSAVALENLTSTDGEQAASEIICTTRGRVKFRW